MSRYDKQMRVTVVLQDKLVAKAKKMLRKKTLKGRLSWWKEEKEFIRKLMEKGPMKGKRRWKREDLYER